VFTAAAVAVYVKCGFLLPLGGQRDSTELPVTSADCICMSFHGCRLGEWQFRAMRGGRVDAFGCAGRDQHSFAERNAAIDAARSLVEIDLLN